MSDTGGLDLIGAAAAPVAIRGYQAYNRHKGFIQGTIDAAQGAQLGGDIGAAITKGPTSWQLAKTGFSAARGALAGTAATTAAAAVPVATAAEIGVASAAATGLVGTEAGAAIGSVAPGVGTAIGAAVGALAPHIIPHIPVVNKLVNKIPVIGGVLSPMKKSDAGGNKPWVPAAPNPFIQSSTDYALGQRAEYQAGRGFR